MEAFKIFLLVMLVACAVSVSLTKRLLTSVIIYMCYSLIMSIVWILLRSPDLAITEAAVGAGVSGILMLLTLKKIRRTATDDEAKEGSANEE